MNNQNSDRLVRLPEIVGLGGIFLIGRTAYYALMNSSVIPRPIKLGRTSAWRLSELAPVKKLSGLTPIMGGNANG